MHSVTYRLNALFTFAISVIGVLCFLCAASVYYKTCVPEVDVDLAAIDKLCVVKRLAYGNRMKVNVACAAAGPSKAARTTRHQ